MRLTTEHKAITGAARNSGAFAGPRDFFAARATGNHLSAQNDEPEPDFAGGALFSEADLIAADKHRNLDKAAALQARDEDALAHQVHMLRCSGGL